MGKANKGVIYLLHFHAPFRHAAHYMGWSHSKKGLEKRLNEHQAGRGARLMQVVAEAGIAFTLARTWEGDKNRERRLKVQGGHSRKCPMCRARLKESHETRAKKTN